MKNLMNKISIIIPIIILIMSAGVVIGKELEDSTDDYNKLAVEYNQLVEMYDTIKVDYDKTSTEYEDVLNKYNELQSMYNLQTDELSAYKEISARSASSSYMDIDIPTIPTDCLGYMYIPTCEVSAFIRYGSTPEAISNYHIGEFEVSEEIGVGNYSVCGHASAQKQLIFSKLENISVGDPIYIYKDGTLYKFSADYMRDVDPDDTWIVESTGTDNPTCTVMCCTDSGERRFVVFGNLVKTKEIEISEN